MIIAIEGMDGSGKTSISREIAKRIGYKYIEKPLKQFFEITDNEYENLCEMIYLLDNRLKALIFGVGNLLALKKGNNIIIDKHVLSTYFWNGSDGTEQIFNWLIEKNIVPDVTIILYSSIENRVRHIKKRNLLDKDLYDNMKMSFGYDKMIEYAERNFMPYVFINGDELTFEEIVNKIILIINNCSNLSEKEIFDYCKNINEIEFNKYEDIKKLCFSWEEINVKKR